MLPTSVALVPFGPGTADAPELLQVAAALQTQVTRDLSPLWGVSGVVSAFTHLDQVPPGYIPLVIVKDLPGPEHGFHFAPNGQPLGMVNYGAGWAARASHELIEILCDPWAQRTIVGPSIKKDQGDVEYLVEVCDPCQFEGYDVNGVRVSDFVTPQFYDTPSLDPPVETDRGRYSFTGRVTRPRGVLTGGYITWFRRTHEGGRAVAEVWQAVPDPEGKLIPGQLVSTPPHLSRDWVDSHPNPTPAGTASPSSPERPGPYYTPSESVKRYGEALRADVKGVLDSLKRAGTADERDAVLRILTKLADPNQKDFRAEFAKDPGSVLDKENIKRSASMRPIAKLPPPADYKKILDAVKEGRSFGPDYGDPLFGHLLATLGTLGTLGTSA